jgi:hypothetical protein
MQAHPAFLVAINTGREAASDRVELALFQRATGYSYKSEKIVTLSGGPGAGSSVERVPIEEHCPPDVTAQSLWLRNRRASEWKDKQTTEITGKDGEPLIQPDVSTEALKARLAALNALDRKE